MTDSLWPKVAPSFQSRKHIWHTRWWRGAGAGIRKHLRSWCLFEFFLFIVSQFLFRVAILLWRWFSVHMSEDGLDGVEWVECVREMIAWQNVTHRDILIQSIWQDTSKLQFKLNNFICYGNDFWMIENLEIYFLKVVKSLWIRWIKYFSTTL